MERQIKVALVGMGFGRQFVPIYLHHPNVSSLIVCDTSEAALREVNDAYGVEETYTTLAEVLADNSIDAVHLVTPIPLHAEQTVAVLNAGKHCACTVPMACSIADMKAIVAAQNKSGKNYMMMETAVYTREFLYARELFENGDFGKVQFLRGAHYQDMARWPSYWMGLPPMHYATHAVSPLLALTGSRAERVHCFGSGSMNEEMHAQYGNTFPIETAIFQLDKPNLAAEVSRSLFETARGYTESFNIYGSKSTFEWQQIESEEPLLFGDFPANDIAKTPRGVRRISAPDRTDLLPDSIARFTQPTIYDESKPHRSFVQGGGHGGSHPHLVHEFVSSIVEDRLPWIDAVRAATWTAPGVCAHQSAMRGGESVDVPQF